MSKGKSSYSKLSVHPDYDWVTDNFSPERNLLWGVLERAIRDLCIRDSDNLVLLCKTIHWFKGTYKKDEIFSYSFIKEELSIKVILQKYIDELIEEAKEYVRQSVAERKASRKRSIFMAAWGKTTLS